MDCWQEIRHSPNNENTDAVEDRDRGKFVTNHTPPPPFGSYKIVKKKKAVEVNYFHVMFLPNSRPTTKQKCRQIEMYPYLWMDVLLHSEGNSKWDSFDSQF